MSDLKKKADNTVFGEMVCIDCSAPVKEVIAFEHTCSCHGDEVTEREDKAEELLRLKNDLAGLLQHADDGRPWELTRLALAGLIGEAPGE